MATPARPIPVGSPLFTAASIDEAARVLLGMLPPNFTGAVIIDRGGDGTRYYSTPGHKVEKLEHLARHLWTEAIPAQGGGYEIRRLDQDLVDRIVASDDQHPATG